MVRVTGWVGFFNGLTQMVDDPASSSNNPVVTLLSSGNPVEALEVTNINSEDTEAEFLILNNVTFVDTGLFSSGTYSVVTPLGDTLTIYIDSATDIPDNPIPGYAVDIAGVQGQYDYSTPYFDGYQLQPRFIADITESAGAVITDLVVSIVGDDAVLNWTAVPGATLYRIYAIDTAYGTPYEIGSTTEILYQVDDIVVGSAQRFFYVTYED